MTGLDTGSPELGNAIFFDHINLAVTDHRLATLFFIEGLGLTRDPYRMARRASERSEAITLAAPARLRR